MDEELKPATRTKYRPTPRRHRSMRLVQLSAISFSILLWFEGNRIYPPGWPPVIFLLNVLVAIFATAWLSKVSAHAPVSSAPGGRLGRFAQLCFSKKVYSRVFEPILSDLRVEYFEALAERDLMKVRFALARNYGAFWLAFVAQLPVSLAKVVVELWLASKTS